MNRRDILKIATVAPFTGFLPKDRASDWNDDEQYILEELLAQSYEKATTIFKLLSIENFFWNTGFQLPKSHYSPPLKKILKTKMKLYRFLDHYMDETLTIEFFRTATKIRIDELIRVTSPKHLNEKSVHISNWVVEL